MYLDEGISTHYSIAMKNTSYVDDYDAFYTEISKLSTEEWLRLIAVLSSDTEFDDNAAKKYPFPVRREVLSFIAKTAILKSNDYRGRTLKNDREFFRLFNEMTSRYYNLTIPMTARAKEENNINNVSMELLRIAHEQFSYMTGAPYHEIGRTLIMFCDYMMEYEGSEDVVEITKKAEALFGMTVQEFIREGLITMFYSVQNKGNLNTLLNPVLEKEGKGLFNFKRCSLYLKYNTITYRDFREQQRKYSKHKHTSKYEFNLLRRYPFVITEKNKFLICPLQHFALERITYGFFYDLVDAFKDEQGTRNKFSEFVGSPLFERYVGDILKNAFPLANIIPEQEYRVGKNVVKSCDWIIAERSGLTLVECKLNDLTVRAKTTDEEEQILKDLKKRYFKALETCERTITHIKDKKLLADEEFNLRCINYLVVVFTPTFMGNDVYRRIAEQQEVKISHDYSIISIADLEKSCTVLSNTSTQLTSFLSLKKEFQNAYTWDFDAFLRDYAKKNNINEDDFRHQLLFERVDRFTNEFLPESK